MSGEKYLKIILFRYVLLFFAVLIVAFVASGHCQTVVPFMGIGNIQAFDNNGVVCPECALYSYQGGTTTQQATYTDYTGLIQNTNPITFSTGGRTNIWLTTGSYYKFVLCVQNDGASCAPADVLFSVDQVFAGSSGTGSGGSPFTGIFISSTSTPATTGILRLASSDSICWRNAAGSANLCLSKDTSDILTWAGGSLKLPEVAAPGCSAGFDYLWADSTVHSFKECGNGGSAFIIAVNGADLNQNQVIQFHFGTTATPLSATAPTTGQYLQWNGTNIVGNIPEIALAGPVSFLGGTAAAVGSCGVPPSSPVVGNGCDVYTFTANHTLISVTYQVLIAPSGCGTSPSIGVQDMTTVTNLFTATPLATGTVTTSVSQTMTAGHRIGLGLFGNAVGCTVYPVFSISAIYQ